MRTAWKSVERYSFLWQYVQVHKIQMKLKWNTTIKPAITSLPFHANSMVAFHITPFFSPPFRVVIYCRCAMKIHPLLYPFPPAPVSSTARESPPYRLYLRWSHLDIYIPVIQMERLNIQNFKHTPSNSHWFLALGNGFGVERQILRGVERS
ncbi:hypothetical protein AVEN_5870-1 [Araneus ventricosus]|uniref:Uncharacterized protein n=1 Tax=Araneus ventricosus TaxID=182803 RepID=A0A4Y2RYD6_ARAVE|nr:hypothetical protein AVEN_5870-1 [Araneus ventricosus]